MSKHPDEAEFLRRLAALPREIAPAKDAWPRISARIACAADAAESAADRIRLWPFATAASVVLMIAAGLLLKNHWSQSALTPSIRDAATAMTLPPGRPDRVASTTTGELEYRAALREFMALNLASRANAGAGPEGIEQGWGTLRRVELELTEAIRDEPDNAFLKSRLAVLRTRQIELLQQIAALDSASRRTNI